LLGFENVLEALCKDSITWLLGAKMVCRVESKKNVGERVRLVNELDEDRGKQSASILFFHIAEVEKKVGHMC
jgi:hypothetical protein